MIKDHELRADGRIQSFNVEGVFAAPGFPLRHVTSTDAGTLYLLHLSGLIGNDCEGKLVGEDAYLQAKQTIENIRTALVAAGNHLGVKIEKSSALSFITFSRVDMADLSQVLEINRAFVDTGMPLVGRAALEAKKLPLNGAVEITVMAAFPK